MKSIVAPAPRELSAGDSSYCRAAWKTIEDVHVLDTFSPPLEKYLAIDKANRQGP